VALALVLFAAATLVVLWVAATTAEGPILFELSATHGVHLHEVLVGVVAYSGAAVAVALAAALTAGGRPPGR
jgi:hypothetical protein